MPADSHPIGVVNVSDIVRESSNRGTVQIGMLYAEKKGEDRFDKLVRSFGFGSVSNLVTGAEVPGLIINPEKWDGMTISRMPMGHSISVTALQIHYAMSTIAADGLLMQPQLVLRVEDSKTKETVVDYPPRARGRVISPSTAKQVASLLRAVCSKTGTAPAADIPGYEVAGKTGTTQKLINGHYSSAHHVASFSGFFPVQDPRLAITVIIDEPKGDGIAYGGKFAAPIFATVAKNCIQWLDIKPTSSISRTVAGVER